MGRLKHMVWLRGEDIFSPHWSVMCKARVEGGKHLLFTLSNCCTPLDKIVSGGYVELE